MRQGFDAVVFDFSGVMVSSAFTAIGEYASGHGMGEDEFIEYLLGPYAQDTDHAWHQAERGEIGIMDWVTDTMSRAEADGLGLDLSFMVKMLGDLEVHDVMVEAARSVRADGYRTSLLTNNIAEGRDSWRPILPLDDLFDDVVDSSEVGLRKPNPAIYRAGARAARQHRPGAGDHARRPPRQLRRGSPGRHDHDPRRRSRRRGRRAEIDARRLTRIRPRRRARSARAGCGATHGSEPCSTIRSNSPSTPSRSAMLACSVATLRHSS